MARREVVIIVKARDEASREIGKVAKSLLGIGKMKFGPVISGIMKIGKVAAIAAGAGVLALGLGLAKLGKDSIKAAGDFEQAMADAAAIMELPIDQMGELRQAALDLSINQNFRVDALGAASAIEMLARNGVNATDILGGMLEATVLLSNSVGTDLSTAANVATDALNIFQLGAGGMENAVAQITGVVNSSKFDIKDYFLALGRGGASLAPLGASFEEFNATLALVSPFFNSGQRAGTALANFFNRLIPTTNKAKDAFLNLGLAVADEETGAFINNFFDQDTGNIKEMGEIIDLLQGSLGRLNAEARQEAILTIFGRDAQGAIAAMLEFGDDYEDVLAKIGNTDPYEAAATRMRTLEGTTEVLKDMIQRLRIELGSAALPILTALAHVLQSVVGKAIDVVSPKMRDFKDLVERILGDNFDGGELSDWADALVRAADILGDMSEGELFEFSRLINEIKTELENGTAAIDVFKDHAADILPASWIRTWIDANKMFTEWSEKITNFVNSPAGEALIKILTVMATRLAVMAGLSVVVTIIGAIAGALTALTAPLAIAATIITLFISAWQNNWFGFRDKMLEVVDRLREIWGLMKQWWDDNGPALTDAFNTFKTTAMTALVPIGEGVKKVGEAIKLFFGGDTQGAVKKLFEAFADFDNAGTIIGDGLAKFLGTAWDIAFADLWSEKVQPAVSKLLGQITTAVSDWVTTGGIGAAFANFSPAAVIGDIIQSIFDISGASETDGAKVGQSLADSISSSVKNADWTEAATNVIGGLKLAWDEVIGPNTAAFITTWLQKFVEWDWISWGVEVVTNLMLGLVGAITPEAFDPWLTAMSTTMSALVNGEGIMAVGEGIIEMIVSGMLIGVFFLGDMFLQIITTVKNFLINTDWETVGENIVNGIVAIFLAPAKMYEAIESWILETWKKITEWWEDIEWDSLGKTITDNLSKGLEDGANGENLTNAVENLITGIRDWFLSPERPWTELGSNIGQGLIDGMNGIMGAVVSAASGLATGIKNAIMAILDMSSPSKVMIDIGHNIGKGLDIGIGDSAPAVNTASANLAQNAIVNPITSGVQGATLAGASGSAFASALAPQGEELGSRHEIVLTIEDEVIELRSLVGEIVSELAQQQLAANGRSVNIRRRTGLT